MNWINDFILDAIYKTPKGDFFTVIDIVNTTDINSYMIIKWDNHLYGDENNNTTIRSYHKDHMNYFTNSELIYSPNIITKVPKHKY